MVNAREDAVAYTGGQSKPDHLVTQTTAASPLLVKHLTSYLHQQMRPSTRRSEITILSFPMSLPSLLSQWKRFETLYGTQTGRDDLLFTSAIDPLFSLFTICGWKQEDIFLYFVFMAEFVLCKKVPCLFHPLRKQVLALGKIFMTAVLLLPTCAAKINTHTHTKKKSLERL